MATFTMELREAYTHLNRDIGLNDYPIFDANYRPTLNAQIYRTYKYHEIGYETPDMFRDRIDAKMHLIMPLYNKLYESERMKFDPLSTFDLTTFSRSDSDGESISEEASSTAADNTGKSRSVSSEFPQTMLNERGDYATGAADSTSESKSGTTADGTAKTRQKGRGTSESRQTGYSGSAADLLARYRSTLLNIDAMIVSELADQFMGVTNIDTNYTGDNYYGFIFPYRYGV